MLRGFVKRTVKRMLGAAGYELRRLPPDRVELRRLFSGIYADNLWGGSRGDFYSGPGSDDAVTQAYVDAVTAFIAARSVGRVVDLGCGDFRVGRRIAASGVFYTGVDIVPALIEHHRREFRSDGVDFLCLDAVEDPLPDGDLCLIRQVLQHLSNRQAAAVLAKCTKYRFVIVSEHIPVGIVPNIDMEPGVGARLERGSGVFVDLPPHGWPATVLLETNPDHPGHPNSVIRTSLIENAPGSSPGSR